MSWTKLRQQEKRMKSFHYTDQDLIENYYKVKEKIGRTPTSNDINNKELSKISISPYNGRYGTWNNYLKSIGEIPTHLIPKHTNKDLIENFYEVKKKLGRQPVLSDLYGGKISKVSGTTYKRHYGSWNKFLKSIGEPLNLDYNPGGKQELIDNYYEVKKRLGKIPTSRKMSDKTISRFDRKHYTRIFGSWTDFLKTIGEKN